MYAVSMCDRTALYDGYGSSEVRENRVWVATNGVDGACWALVGVVHSQLRQPRLAGVDELAVISDDAISTWQLFEVAPHAREELA